VMGYGDTGGASRFFYCAKAPKSERWFYCGICDDAYPSAQREDHAHGKKPKDQKHIIMHPTQKPVELMRYLCRLTATPTGGTVLDPFMGSGTTGMACVMEGRDFIGIEIDAEYMEIARRRIAWVQEQQPDAVQLEFQAG
jgi:site-specific DNA-methyltransferase (adenine-specific)